MELIIFAFIVGIVYAIITAIKERRKKKKQDEQMERIKREQEAQMEMLLQTQHNERERVRQMAILEREQTRQAKQIAKHDEMLMKLDIRLASAENEIAFNREQRERLFKLLDAEKEKQNGTQKDSDAWMKHERKIIALENQIHTAQKRIDKAQADKYFCEKKMSA